MRKWPYRAVCKIDRELTTLLHNLNPAERDGRQPINAELQAALTALLAKRELQLHPVQLRLYRAPDQAPVDTAMAEAIYTAGAVGAHLQHDVNLHVHAPVASFANGPAAGAVSAPTTGVTAHAAGASAHDVVVHARSPVHANAHVTTSASAVRSVPATAVACTTTTATASSAFASVNHRQPDTRSRV
jgi:hypothetical protein